MGGWVGTTFHINGHKSGKKRGGGAKVGRSVCAQKCRQVPGSKTAMFSFASTPRQDPCRKQTLTPHPSPLPPHPSPLTPHPSPSPSPVPIQYVRDERVHCFKDILLRAVWSEDAAEGKGVNFDSWYRCSLHQGVNLQLACTCSVQKIG